MCNGCGIPTLAFAHARRVKQSLCFPEVEGYRYAQLAGNWPHNPAQPAAGTAGSPVGVCVGMPATAPHSYQPHL